MAQNTTPASIVTEATLKDDHGNPITLIPTGKSMDSLGERPACFKNTTAEVLFVVAATMSVGMSSVLYGGLSVITSEIGRDLDMNNAEITWIMASASLAAGSFLLFFGKVADLTSRRWQFIGSMFLFSIFALGTGFVKSGLLFDIFNGILGLLCAAAVPPAIGSLGATYPTPCKRKNYAFACFSAGNPLGFVFGSIACGICTQILNWRSFLYFLAILYLVFAIIAFFVTPVDHDDKKPLNWETLKSFDIVGTILTIAGFGLLSASLSLAGDAPEGWHTPYVIATLVVGIVLIAVFLYWETRATSPLLPMWVWKDRDFSLLLLILFIGFGGFSASSFFLTLQIQRFMASSTIMVAVYILPMAIMGTIVNIVAGLILHRVSNKLLMFIGTACYTLSFLLMGLNRDDDKYWYFIFWALLLNVWGADLQFNVANMYIMTSLSSEQQSTGGSIFQMVGRLSTAIVLGIATAIFNAVDQHPPQGGYLAGQKLASYDVVYYFCSAICAFSMIFVPFLRIGTQGGVVRKRKVDEEKQVSEPSSGRSNEKDADMRIATNEGRSDSV